MQFKAYLILLLMALVIAAPVVDAVTCDDCKDSITVRSVQQRLSSEADHAGDHVLSSADARAAEQETDAAQDLCPACSNSTAATDITCCGAPSMISHTNHLPKLIALSSPSYSINKPPQN